MYRILYEEVDESEVKIYNFPSTNTNGMGDIEQYRFDPHFRADLWHDEDK